jgi:hypothetical protein
LDSNFNAGEAQFHDALAMSRGLIVSVTGVDDPLIAKVRQRHIAIAARHGVPTYLAAPLGDLPALHRLFEEVEHWRRPRIVTLYNQQGLLDSFVDHQPGPSWGRDVKFTGPGWADLGEEDKLLLHRAFQDCTEVRLESLPGGNAKVLQAFAQLRTSLAGPCPLPFFVKIDRYPKIAREIENYHRCTLLFVPFYARPNVDPDRCMLGHERGIIVGNFVEHSNSLAELITRGSAQTAISSLFDDALRGWRRQAILPTTGHVDQPLAMSLGGAAWWKGADLAEVRAGKAKRFGAKLSAADLAARFDGLPAIKHRQALMHGGLHAENVRVRNGQAILIDFAAVKQGPLVADPAGLETAICLTASEPDEAIWRSGVEELYEPSNLAQLPQTRLPGDPLANLFDAVRQIRRYGISEEQSPHEYATAIGISLLRHAYRQAVKDEHEDRRPYLFAIAEKVVRDIQKQ